MRNLIVVSTMLVIGLGQAKILINDAAGLTGMALAAIIGIILNLVLPEEKPDLPQGEKSGPATVKKATSKSA
jgi:uracil permease